MDYEEDSFCVGDDYEESEMANVDMSREISGMMTDGPMHRRTR